MKKRSIDATNIKGDYSDFDVVVTASSRGRSSVKELLQYRDMILLLVRRDFVATYKQTVLGPAWAVIQPIVSTIITALVFGGLAGLSPDGVPVFLFYMAGQISWTFFSGVVNGTSGTFVNNSALMGKVYFPRFAVPVAGMLSQLVSFAIQICIFTVFYIGYVIGGAPISPHATALLIPLYIAHMAVLGLGTGAILSALTTKYRDTLFLISYGLTFWMYLSPVVYDIDRIPDRFFGIYMLNPFASIINNIRYALFQNGQIYWNYYLISAAVSLLLLLSGYRVFDRVERNFVDTI